MPSYRQSFGYRLFTIGNMVFLTLLAFSCLFPLIHVFAISLSSAQAVSAGAVKLWPVDFTFASYETVFTKKAFLQSFGITLQRTLLGTSISMLLITLLAYPLSKDSRQFRFRTVYAWFFVFTIIFGGGLIPSYMVVKETGLIDSIWALVIPSAVPVFNAVLLLNFFRNLPKELEESARLDGANHWTTLWRIYVPVSLPALATVLLFTIIGHWNSWFDGLIYMNQPEKYPLQTFLQASVISKNLSEMTAQEAEKFFRVNDRTGRAAQIFVASLPILLAYPFLQRFFMKGIVLGSVKE
ncbi:carbohydrate ABC transporter permease [Paenibacillus sp. PAMC21692]|uniref:carbohydrate ABC transporter permease n=1 Tax=Paenibacillus sp. PAMC21692 TaxID=2762320 RepID=UPI00164EC4FE|nr:carbohydrate ABC transporter permease [Paenibacillus sp. PAMC21692]QNK56833.1 carbohydrate ABC transporter permease [Paenibacillus sp. PAMC21692]